jgi:hypothetical protein
LTNAISFANADDAKSSFGTIASTAMRNNVGPDIRSRHRRGESAQPYGNEPDEYHATAFAFLSSSSSNDATYDVLSAASTIGLQAFIVVANSACPLRGRFRASR